MSDIKEKLVELMEYARQIAKSKCKLYHNCVGCSVQNRCKDDICQDLLVANELIANGVTIQEWISVEERLPERKDPKHKRDFYLVTLSNGMVKELAYEHEDYDNMLFDPGWHPTSSPVTHWMQLPEPPAEEVNKDA